MEQGPESKREEIEKIARATRRTLDDVPERPDLLPGLKLYYEAFAELNTCRHIGTAEGPVPYTAVVQWMDENEVYGDQRSNGIRILRSMDSAYLDFLDKKREFERKIRESQKPK